MIKKKIIDNFSVLLCMFITTVTVFTATSSAVWKLEKVVKNTTVCIDNQSVENYWETYISRGANKCVHPGWSKLINVTFVSSNYRSDIYFYADPVDMFFDYWEIVYAVTEHYYGKLINMNYDSSNWTYWDITINDGEFKNQYFQMKKHLML